MYVCLCEGVSDHEIHKAVQNGACSVTEVMRCTRAGTRCGACRSEVAEMVASAHGSTGHRHLDVLDAFCPSVQAA